MITRQVGRGGGGGAGNFACGIALHIASSEFRPSLQILRSIDSSPPECEPSPPVRWGLILSPCKSSSVPPHTEDSLSAARGLRGGGGGAEPVSCVLLAIRCG